MDKEALANSIDDLKIHRKKNLRDGWLLASLSVFNILGTDTSNNTFYKFFAGSMAVAASLYATHDFLEAREDRQFIDGLEMVLEEQDHIIEKDDNIE